jgi:hypothetical protein
MVRVDQVSGPANGPPPPSATPAAATDRRKDLLQLPLFKKAADVLGAQLVKVDEGYSPTGGPATTGFTTDTDEG